MSAVTSINCRYGLSPPQRRADMYGRLLFHPSSPPLRLYLHEPGYEVMFNYFYHLYKVDTVSSFGGDDVTMMDLLIERQIHTDRFAAKCEDEGRTQEALREWS